MQRYVLLVYANKMTIVLTFDSSCPAPSVCHLQGRHRSLPKGVFHQEARGTTVRPAPDSWDSTGGRAGRKPGSRDSYYYHVCKWAVFGYIHLYSFGTFRFH